MYRNVCVYFVFLLSLSSLHATTIPAPWENVPIFHKARHHKSHSFSEADAPYPSQHPRAREILFRPLHYELDLAIDPPSGNIRGSLRFTFSPLNSRLRQLTLDAYGFTFEHISIGNNPLQFNYDGRLLSITLPPQIALNQPTTVLIRYTARPRKNLYYVGPDITNPHRMPAAYTYSEPEGSKYWFPCLDLPSAKAAFDIKVKVPAPFKVLSNGDLLASSSREISFAFGSGHDRGTKAPRSNYFHYRMRQPIAPYAVSVAIGNYELVSLGSYKRTTLSLWTPPQLKQKALRETANTREMMALFSRLTGVEYPFATYSQSVAQAWQTSMEHQTATTMGGYRIAGDGSGEDVVAHELAHQWFGDWVTCNNWNELWLNEGFASYFPMLYLSAAQKHEASLSYEDYWRQAYFAEAAYFVRPLSAAHPAMADIFDSHAYAKGALVIKLFHQLSASREENYPDLKEAHPALFTQILQRYLRLHGGKSVRSSDLQEAAETVSGRSWEQFFAQWVRSAGHPILHAAWQQQGNKFSLAITQNQAIDAKKNWINFAFPLTIEALSSKGERRLLQVKIHDTYQVVSFELPFTVAAINLDPEWVLPMEWRLENTRRITSNFFNILAHSPSEKSRIYALRRLVEAKLRPLPSDLESLLTADSSLYLQADALALLSNDAANALLVATLLKAIEAKQGKAPFDLPIIAAIAAARTWLYIQQAPTPRNEEIQQWQTSYLDSPYTSERKSLLDRLAFASLPMAQSFALARLKESSWNTRDRQALIDVLSTQPTATSLPFVLESLKTSALHWFLRICEHLYTSQFQHPELAPILIEQLQNNRYSMGRIAATNLLSVQLHSNATICPLLPQIREQLVQREPREAELIVAIDHASINLHCQ